MPSQSEFSELVENCDVAEYTLYGVVGLLFTSKSNGNQIFLPSAGFYNGTVLEDKSTGGRYWSTNYQSSQLAIALHFEGTVTSTTRQEGRRCGFTIRPVYDPNT